MSPHGYILTTRTTTTATTSTNTSTTPPPVCVLWALIMWCYMSCVLNFILQSLDVCKSLWTVWMNTILMDVLFAAVEWNMHSLSCWWRWTSVVSTFHHSFVSLVFQESTLKSGRLSWMARKSNFRFGEFECSTEWSLFKDPIRINASELVCLVRASLCALMPEH